jgi:hypothetical protein
MQNTGQELASAGSALFKNIKPDRKFLVAVFPQINTSHDNASSKQVREVCLEETGYPAAWHNQLKGCVTKRRNRRHGIRNPKSATSQLIIYFLYRETA